MPFDVSSRTGKSFDRARAAASVLLAVAALLFGLAVWQQSTLNAMFDEARRPVLSSIEDGSGGGPVLRLREPTAPTAPPTPGRSAY